MKKLMFYLALLVCFMVMPVGIQAYTINDPGHDSIGYPVYESYGINVYNYTPGTNSGSIRIDLFSNFPPTGNTVGSWNTQPADLFITETYFDTQYQWAIPTVSHGIFSAGTMYAVGTYRISDNFAPPSGGYTYNHNVPVWIDTLGTNYNGYQYFSGGSISYIGPAGSMPYYRYSINTNIWQDDPNGVFAFTWGTATCANDVVTGQVSRVPEPATLLLLGSGLIGLGGFRGLRKKFRKE